MLHDLIRATVLLLLVHCVAFEAATPGFQWWLSVISGILASLYASTGSRRPQP